MRYEKTVRILAAAGVAAIATWGSAPAFAQQAYRGLYVLGGVGQSRFSMEQGPLDAQSVSIGNPGASVLDKTDTGYKLGVGYDFNRYLGVEGAYNDLRHFNYASPGAPGVAVDARADAWSVFGVGKLPVAEGFSLLGKLGAASTRVKSDVVQAQAYSDDEDRTNFAWGLGGQYDFTRNVGLRLEYENFGKGGSEPNFAAGTGTGMGKLSMVSLSVVGRF